MEQNADILCLQETRVGDEHLGDKTLVPDGYSAWFNNAKKKGYSGVAIYSRHGPDNIYFGHGWPGIEDEARYLQADFGGLSVASLYLPSGSSGPERQAVKFDFMSRFMDLLKSMKEMQRDYILCGDWNIAHKTDDIKNWRANQKNSGFLPEERAWMDELFGKEGFVDAFRVVCKDAGRYTWWSNRGRARDNNVGWRIDYQVVTPGLAKSVDSADIFRERFFSDHAPLIIDYRISLGMSKKSKHSGDFLDIPHI
jgi:exodeoxyribonuclease-3